MIEQINLQSMMEEAEQSAERLLKIREKTEQIKKDCENQELEKFLKIYLKINQDDENNFEANRKFMNLTQEIFSEQHAEYFEYMRFALELNDLTCAKLAEYLPRKIVFGGTQDLKTHFADKFLNNEIKIPNFYQWKIAMDEGLSELLLIPGQIVGFDFEKCLSKALEAKGWIIKITSSHMDQRITQAREMDFYPIFVADQGDPLSELRYEPVESKLEYLKSNSKRIRKQEEDLRLVGLTLNEFLYNFFQKLNAGIPLGNLSLAVIQGGLLDERIFRSDGTDNKNPISFLSVTSNPEDNVLAVFSGALHANPRVGLKLPRLGIY